LHKDAVIPKQTTKLSGGWDVTCTEITQEKPDFVICKLGFALQPPPNYKVTLVPRSSLTKTNWIVQNSPGLGDADYLGEYQFVFTENNGVCPPVTDVVLVNFGALPQTLSKTDPICNSSCDGTITSNSPDADEWRINGGPWQNSPVFTGLCAGSYTVTARNALGCTANNTIALINPASAVISTSPDEVICINGTTNLTATATGGTTSEFHWDHTADLSGTQVVTPSTELTTYSVYAVNQNGCESPASEITISWYPSLSGSISVNDTVCPTQSGTLFVSNVSSFNMLIFDIRFTMKVLHPCFSNPLFETEGGFTCALTIRFPFLLKPMATTSALILTPGFTLSLGGVFGPL
jgi:dUTPase